MKAANIGTVTIGRHLANANTIINGKDQLMFTKTTNDLVTLRWQHKRLGFGITSQTRDSEGWVLAAPGLDLSPDWC